MKQIITLTLYILLYSTQVWGQQITGRVLDASKSTPLEGASIQCGSEQVIISNEQGEFTVSCTKVQTLKVSMIGYELRSLEAVCGSDLTIELTPVATHIEMVRVNAFTRNQRSLIDQPHSITHLQENELDRNTGIYLADAINTNVTGVMMNRRTQSGGQQFNIRGYGNGMGIRGVNSNFDSQGVKVYLNGVAITDAEGITVMDDIDFGLVNDAEILKGPSGTLYGLAISGVVNLTTERAKRNTTTLSQEVTAGSYGLLRSTSRLSLGTDKASLLLSYGHQAYGGFMEHTAAKKDFVNVVSDIDINDKQTLTSFLGYSNGYNERNGELEQGQYEALDYSGNAKYIIHDAHSAIRTIRFGVAHSYTCNSLISNNTSVFGAARSIDQSSGGGWTDKQPIDAGFRSTFDLNYNLKGNLALSGIAGVEMQKLTSLSLSYKMNVDSTNLNGYHVITSLSSNQALSSSTASCFTQWKLILPAGFSIHVGVGMSQMQIAVADRLWAINGNNYPGSTVSQTYNTSYKHLISPNASIHKSIGTSNAAYLSYSTGYKAPVGSNIIIPYTGEINSSLRPEHGGQLELGAKGKLLNDRLQYGIVVFRTRFSEKFTAQTVQDSANTVTLYSYVVNGGSLDNRGLEVAASYDLIRSGKGAIRKLKPFINLTYSNFKYADYRYSYVGKGDLAGTTVTEDYSGLAVAGVSPIVFNAGIDLLTGSGVYGNVNMNYRSSMYYTSDGVNSTDPYTLVNAKTGYRLQKGKITIDAAFGANNITSTQYYYMLFVNQLPDAYIPGPRELNFFGQFKLSYTL